MAKSAVFKGLILSNDGEIIFLATTWSADENRDGMKSISVYKHGQLIRGFTESEVNGCDKKRERCELVYNNGEKIVDYMSSVILYLYHDWLNDKKDTWKTWEETRKPHR